MKKTIVILLTVYLLSGCQTSQRFEIAGTIKNSNEELIYLDEIKTNDLETVDSTYIDKNGNFRFRGDVAIPKFFIIKTNQDNYLTLLLNPGEKISIEANMENLGINYKLKGSKDSRIIQEYNVKRN